MNFFDQAALRLKQSLQVEQDKEVATLLAMSARAWAGRKKNDSFPEVELRALAQRRPDLGIDVEYVLTGGRMSPHERQAVDRASMSAPADDKAPGAAVLRACAMVELLVGHLPEGLPNKDIAAALGCTPSTVTRTADVLIAHGWLRKLPTGHYCASVQFARLVTRVLNGFVEADRRLQAAQANHLREASPDAVAWLRQFSHPNH